MIYKRKIINIQLYNIQSRRIDQTQWVKEVRIFGIKIAEWTFDDILEDYNRPENYMEFKEWKLEVQKILYNNGHSPFNISQVDEDEDFDDE
jgi:hypothetical protein